MATYLAGAVFDKVLTNALGTTPELSVVDVLNGAIRFPSDYESTEVDIYGAEKEAGTFEKVYDKLAVQAKIIVPTASLPAKVAIPAEAFDWPYLKLVANNGNDNTRTVTLSMRF